MPRYSGNKTGLISQTTVPVVVPVAPAAALPVGPVIPDNMVRRVSRITIVPPAGPAGIATVNIYQGSVAVPLALLKISSSSDGVGFGTPGVLGRNNEGNVPILVFRPTTSTAPTTLNQIYVQATTLGAANAIITIEYHDVRG